MVVVLLIVNVRRTDFNDPSLLRAARELGTSFLKEKEVGWISYLMTHTLSDCSEILHNSLCVHLHVWHKGAQTNKFIDSDKQLTNIFLRSSLPKNKIKIK